MARFEGRDGRKIRTWGGMYNGDELTAEAEAIFIELLADRFFAKMAQKDDSASASGAGGSDSGSGPEPASHPSSRGGW